jgi:hypothetical protein
LPPDFLMLLRQAFGGIDTELLGVWVAALLTLMVFSYLLGDNPLYQLAQHLFIGTTLGYAALIAVTTVLGRRLVAPLLTDPAANWDLAVPFVLGLLLLLKVRPGTARLGNVALGYLVGVGAAVALGGALFGTLRPQLATTVVSVNPVQAGGWGPAANRVVLIAGTVATLVAFTFSAGRRTWSDRLRSALVWPWARLGRWVLMITFGALFASVAVARLTLLIGRLQFLLIDWLHLVR